DAPTIEATLAAMMQAMNLFRRSPEVYLQVQQNAMAQLFTWDIPARQYTQLYQRLLTEDPA
ncbi:MAG: hypothetical protein WED11_12095, partial [Natronospirillum sp.]